jgi:hypothetical protein
MSERSDFDTVLERLLTDAEFQAALGQDADRALHGYALDDEERALLRSQLVLGGQQTGAVEARTTKSGVVGLLGPMAAALAASAGSGPGSSVMGGSGRQSLGSAPGGEAFGTDRGGEAFGPARSGGSEAFGARQGGREVFGASESEAFGASAPGGETFGASTGGTETWGDTATEGFGGATSGEGVGPAPVEATDYHTRVDVDGDGSWDAHRAYERADGGVDIHVDADGDGAVDFIGHDRDRDGLVDSAEFDNDRDGTFETRMRDDDGDGWMDRSERVGEGRGPDG